MDFRHPENATVSESGVVSGVKAGNSDITATLFGVSGKSSVTVAAVTVAA